MEPNDIVIVAAKRTPCGNFLGNLSSLSAPKLAAVAHRAAIAQAGINPADISEVLTGCVLQAGIGQAPARQGALFAGLPNSVGATTINKVCGSGLKAIMLGHDLIKANAASVVLAGGMESMSSVPYLLAGARKGYRLGHGSLVDDMFFDGLEDAYQPGQLMGNFADQTAIKYNFSREAQDTYAASSMTKAVTAREQGVFNDEIAPVTVLNSKKEEMIVNQDEGPDQSKAAKLSRLRPAFSETGTVTAGNSSSISDGAASLILMTAEEAKRRNITPLARIVAHTTHSQEPAWFTTAPVGAIEALMKKAGWSIDQVDFFEINEAFAVVAMAAIESLKLNPEKVNVYGGACALGHPLGASGARIVVTLLNALKRHNKTRGVAALCIGGGEANAMAIERIV